MDGPQTGTQTAFPHQKFWQVWHYCQIAAEPACLSDWINQISLESKSNFWDRKCGQRSWKKGPCSRKKALKRPWLMITATEAANRKNLVRQSELEEWVSWVTIESAARERLACLRIEECYPGADLGLEVNSKILHSLTLICKIMEFKYDLEVR